MASLTDQDHHGSGPKSEVGSSLSAGVDARTPCGFAFVEYYLHSEAVDCLRYISGTKLDERIIRCDIDPGYKEGRQFGRGKSGGQVRDEFRQEYDSGRGKWPQAYSSDIQVDGAISGWRKSDVVKSKTAYGHRCNSTRTLQSEAWPQRTCHGERGMKTGRSGTAVRMKMMTDGMRIRGSGGNRIAMERVLSASF